MASSAELLTSPGSYNAAPAFADKAVTLLDFTQKLDIALLDSVVACFYSTTGAEVCAYNTYVTSLVYIIYIFAHCVYRCVKFFGKGAKFCCLLAKIVDNNYMWFLFYCGIVNLPAKNVPHLLSFVSFSSSSLSPLHSSPPSFSHFLILVATDCW